MPIRVIAGSAKGRRLKLVPGDTTRPVMDRVKEAAFSIMGRDLYGARFLDLFAGTGSIGIEALSRGADQAVFVELNRLAVKTIQENLELTRLGDQAVIRRTDVLSLLQQAPPAEPFDFIWIAPPQYKGLWLETLKALDANPDWVMPETTVIVQIDPKEAESVEALVHLQPYDERQYGKTMLWFFSRRDPQADEDES
jgi:16S rRNA (guanine(966)-N(2))-methyltransferase RsmD